MSTAAPAPESISTTPVSSVAKSPGKAGGYTVARAGNRCIISGKVLEPGEKIMAALRETAEGFERLDISLEAWPQFDRKDVVADWQTTVPRHEQKKKLFVDDAVLCELFERLAGVSEPAKLNFRFVLGLILMRKRMLVYESSKTTEDGREVWTMRFRGREDLLDMLNPKLDEQQVTDVSRQMGEILNEDL